MVEGGVWGGACELAMLGVPYNLGGIQNMLGGGPSAADPAFWHTRHRPAQEPPPHR
jgi:hypothetical protein